MRKHDSIGMAALALSALLMSGCATGAPVSSVPGQSTETVTTYSVGLTETGKGYLKRASVTPVNMGVMNAAFSADSTTESDVWNFVVPFVYVDSHKVQHTSSVDYVPVLYNGKEDALMKVEATTSSTAVQAAFGAAAASTEADVSNYKIDFASSGYEDDFNDFCKLAGTKFSTAVTDSGTIERSVKSQTFTAYLFKIGEVTSSIMHDFSITISDKESPTLMEGEKTAIDFSDKKAYADDYLSYSKESPMYQKSYETLSNAILAKYKDNDTAEDAAMSVVFKDGKDGSDVVESGKTKFIDDFIDSCCEKDSSGTVTLSIGTVYYEVKDLSGNSVSGSSVITLRDDIAPKFLKGTDEADPAFGLGDLDDYPKDDFSSDMLKVLDASDYRIWDEIDGNFDPLKPDGSKVKVGFSINDSGLTVKMTDVSENVSSKTDKTSTSHSIIYDDQGIAYEFKGKDLVVSGSKVSTDKTGTITVSGKIRLNKACQNSGIRKTDLEAKTALWGSMNFIGDSYSFSALSFEGSAITEFSRTCVRVENKIVIIATEGKAHFCVESIIASSASSKVFLSKGNSYDAKAISCKNIFFEGTQEEFDSNCLFDKTGVAITYGVSLSKFKTDNGLA